MRWLSAGLVACSLAGLWAAPQPSPGAIRVRAVAVSLNPRDPSQVAVGGFTYAGGLDITCDQTDQLHGLSDIRITGDDRLTAVGDHGVWFEARLVLGPSQHLDGIADGRLAPLTGEDGRPLAADADTDAEGLAVLANGDRLVSFERRHRIWRYPASGGAPRPAASPTVAFPDNGGMEALAADPDAGPDAYVVGGEESGRTWTCRLSSGGCVEGPTVSKPAAYGLVAITRLPGGRTAYLLRATDGLKRNHLTLRIQRGPTVLARLDLAPPMTTDNFEGVAAVPRADGSVRFYLLSDDNASVTQRTLLFAFDWRPRG